MRSALLLSAVALLAAEDWNQNTTPNQTSRREANGSIRSVYRDVRTDFGGVQSGYPMPDWTLFTSLEYERWTAERSADQVALSGAPAASGENFYQRRDDATLTMRASLGLGCAFEVSQVGSRTDDLVNGGADYTWGDVRTSFLVPLWSSRYSGISLELGATHPTGQRDDWITSHGGWTYACGVRSSVGLGMWTITAQARGEYCPIGNNIVTATPDDLHLQNTYQSVSGGVSVSYRPCRWMRFGVSQRGSYAIWEQRGDEVVPFKGQDLLKRAPAMGVLEFNPAMDLAITGAYGVDLASGGDSGQRQVMTGSLSYRF